ncbi:alpha/beta hydrolase [Hydrocarboniphaga sp.]|uniref:alpha/beta hydrolase n=1 Tax=Hydrocarboniphaga sp. TaxID=2033016 RepID=UPI00345659C8
MSSKHLVDPELLAALETLPSFTFSSEVLPLVRQGLDDMLAALPAPEGLQVDVTERRIATPQGHDIGVLIYTPSGTGVRPAVLHMHGGGYILGRARMNDISNRMLAIDAQCVIISVDYRLAPETPHPGSLEDCYAALKWVHDNAEALGVDRRRIAVSGESAGGGLAAALALLARDRGEVPLIFQRLIYPMIDDRTGTGAHPHPYTGEFVWTAASNRFGWSSLLGRAPGGEGVSAYAATARAENLAGLPAAYIGVGALDLFLEESIEYARRLTRAGVPTELHVYPGAYHAFDAAPEARVTQAAQRDALHALLRALHPEID